MKKNKWSIKWQLFGYLSLLVGILLILLWLIQVVFLESIYKRIKTNEVVEIGRNMSGAIYSQEAKNIFDTVSKDKNVSIVVTTLLGQKCYISPFGENQGFGGIENVRYYVLARYAESSGGEFLYEGDPLEKEFELENGFVDSQHRRYKSDTVTYTRIIDTLSGERYALFVISAIAPVEATVDTIRSQLFYVTLVMLVLAFLLSLYIAKKIANPIIKINDQAKQLATNCNEEMTFEGKGYKEIAELSSTLSFASTELARTENLRRELIANVSHDLRTPLTLICGYAEMMRDLPGENTAENTQVIIDEATRLTILVNDMLNLSKLQQGIQTLDKRTYNLTDNIKETMKRYTAFTEQEGYQITFDYDQEAFINADEIKISQVVYNLINNAINYTGIDKKVAVKQKIVNNKVRIEVTDTGEGISKENLPYIWDRYYKVDKAHKRAAIGTGLGLSIVQNILKAHEAIYGVESELGKGSTFWFEITYCKDSAQ